MAKAYIGSTSLPILTHKAVDKDMAPAGWGTQGSARQSLCFPGIPQGLGAGSQWVERDPAGSKALGQHQSMGGGDNGGPAKL